MSKASRAVASALAKVVYGLKMMALAGIVLGSIVLVGAAFAFTAPADVTYSNDEFTVANSSDGQQVVITYEVSTTLKEDASKTDRKQAMDTMAEVGACVNGRLDGWIQDNSKERAVSANLQEVVIDCEQGDVSIERITVADSKI